MTISNIINGLRGLKLFLLASFIIVGWMLVLSFRLSFISDYLLVATMAVFWLVLVLSATPKMWKSRALFFYCACLLFYTIFIVLIQLLPQWKDVNPDSITYDLQAKAIAKHLSGDDVYVRKYRLNVVNGDVWRSDSIEGYSTLMGSSNYFYQLYIGVIYYLTRPDKNIAIMSHAPMLATLPVVTFLLAFKLLSSLRLSALAGVLVLLDSGFSVNAAWLLKDTMVTSVTLYAFLLSVILIERKTPPADSGWLMVGLVICLVVLSLSRFHVAIAFWAVLSVGALYLYKKKGVMVVNILFVIFSSYYLSGIFKVQVADFSSAYVYKRAFISNITSANLSLSVIKQSAGAEKDKAIDGVVNDFYKRLQESPLKTILQAVARTLFAPYPWVAVTEGFKGKNVELYWPGTILWMLGLPFLMIGLYFTSNANFKIIFPLLVTIIIVVAYILTIGEFSARQKQFLMPIFWIWIALGIHETLRFLDEKKKKRLSC